MWNGLSRFQKNLIFTLIAAFIFTLFFLLPQHNHSNNRPYNHNNNQNVDQLAKQVSEVWFFVVLFLLIIDAELFIEYIVILIEFCTIFVLDIRILHVCKGEFFVCYYFDKNSFFLSLDNSVCSSVNCLLQKHSFSNVRVLSFVQ